MFVMNRRRSLSLPNNNAAQVAAANDSKTTASGGADLIPVFCPVDDWCRLSGLTRSATYKALADGWLPSLKVGKTRLIDVYPALEAIRSKFGTSQAA
jgi:hypothetical protein